MIFSHPIPTRARRIGCLLIGAWAGDGGGTAYAASAAQAAARILLVQPARPAATDEVVFSRT